MRLMQQMYGHLEDTQVCNLFLIKPEHSSGSRGRGGHPPPGSVKISNKKDGHRRRPHRFHVSRPLPPPLTRLLDPLLEHDIGCCCCDCSATLC